MNTTVAPSMFFSVYLHNRSTRKVLESKLQTGCVCVFGCKKLLERRVLCLLPAERVCKQRFFVNCATVPLGLLCHLF